MKGISRNRPRARWRYIVLLSLEGGRPAQFIHEDLVAAQSEFFLYFGVMKSRTRLKVATCECLRVTRCELHKTSAPVINVENLNADTLIRSSDDPFTFFELNNSPFLPTLH